MPDPFVFVALDAPPPSIEAADRLTEAVFADRHQFYVLRGADLSNEEAAKVRGYLARGSYLHVISAG